MISPVPVTFKVDMSEQLVVSGVTIFGMLHQWLGQHGDSFG